MRYVWKCDYPGCNADLCKEQSILREFAIKKGWRVDETGHYCPVHK